MHFNIKVPFVILCFILYILKKSSRNIHKLHQTGKGVHGTKQVWKVRWLRVGGEGRCMKAAAAV